MFCKGDLFIIFFNINFCNFFQKLLWCYYICEVKIFIHIHIKIIYIDRNTFIFKVDMKSFCIFLNFCGFVVFLS